MFRNIFSRKTAITIPPELVLDISSEGQLCSQFCMADFVAAKFIQGKLTKNSNRALCNLIGEFYGVLNLREEELRQLLALYSLPSQRQRILGLPFARYTKNNAPHSFNSDNTADQDVFAPIATELHFAVQLFIEGNAETIFQDLIPLQKKSQPQLKVYYRVRNASGHYDRVADDQEEALLYRSWETVAEGNNGLRKLPDIQPSEVADVGKLSQTSAFASVITKELLRIQQAKQSQVFDAANSSSASPAASATIPPKSARSPSSSFFDMNAYAAQYRAQASPATESWKALVKKEGNNPLGNVNYSGDNGRMIQVTRKRQTELDKQLAQEMQDKEFHVAAELHAQCQADEALARELQAEERAFKRRK